MDHYTVLLISSDAVGWDELRRILQELPSVRLVGEASCLDEGQHLARASTPDVIIAPATIGGRSTLPVLTNLHRDCGPTSKIILFAARYEPGHLRTPIEAGVVGYLLWSDLSPAVLRHALAAVIAGDIILGSRAVVTAFVAGLQGEGQVRLAAARITERERAVLGRLAAGLTHEQIAAVEPLSLRTVERTIADLQRKLDAPNQFVLAVTATRLGLIR